MILYHACCWIVLIADVVVDVLLGHLDEHYVGNAISDLKAAELEGRPVVC